LLANVLSFASLYFYIVEKLKENDILKESTYIYLSPLILIGFIPLKLPGIFENIIKNFFSNILLASPGNVSSIVGSNKTQLPFSNLLGNLKTLLMRTSLLIICRF